MFRYIFLQNDGILCRVIVGNVGLNNLKSALENLNLCVFFYDIIKENKQP